jgi:hypothetical protein
MTLPHPASPGKPRRLGLYLPFAVLLIAVALWAVAWSWMGAQVFRRMDQGASVLSEAGWRADWRRRRLSGFPFRLDLDIEGPRMREVSGWGLAAPRLKAEAFVFAPGHWVIVAPEGATLARRRGGEVMIGARALRASLSDFDARPPRLSVEGLDLTFAPARGAAPVVISAAAGLHIHAKAGPRDQGAAYLEIDGARVAGPGPLADLAAGAPVTLVVDGIYSHSAALGAGAPGSGLAGALRAWSEAGGEVTVRRLGLSVGGAAAEARSGTLGIGPDGRLRGALALRVKQPQRLMAAVGAVARPPPEALRSAQAIIATHAEGEATSLDLDFQAGQTTLGPVAIAPAPRLY